ncbi:hypothetical protein PV325_008491 [Microctonus aethiopoides]|nr:hypothetical protein PV325_008491 [Microctonus aethiopoides]KAK0093552.1 hypothetical protein PV326_013284 [Microctonus aethiopoides]
MKEPEKDKMLTKSNDSTDSNGMSEDKSNDETTQSVAQIHVTSSSNYDNDINPDGSSKLTSHISRIFLVSRCSPQSSSSTEDYEPETKHLPGASLGVNGVHQVAARSMESLRHSRNFLSADERYEDSRSLESLTTTRVATGSSSSTTGLLISPVTKTSHQQHHHHHHHHQYRSFLSCSSTSSSSSISGRRRTGLTTESRSSENLMRREESLNAEVRRGLYANTALERKAPRLHLSLPQDDHDYTGGSGPPGVFSLTSPGGSDRKIHILSPHSPLPFADLQHQYSVQSLKSRRSKAHVLPRLVLPRSESDVFLQ